MLTKLSYLDRIKLTMMAMMTTGHIAWAFVPTESLLSQLMHFFARSTVVLACFLVVEGFCLTKNLTGYLKRLFIFGLIAQIPYIMMSVGVWRIVYEPSVLLWAINVLITLGLCLLSLILCQAIQKSQTPELKIGYGFLILVLMLGSFLLSTDWNYVAILWTLGIYYKRLIGFIGVTAVLIISSVLFDNEFADYAFSGQLMDYGLILALPIIYWYDKNKQNSPKNYRLPRTLFYWYYVIHALIIGLLVQYTPYATDEYGVIMEQNGTVRAESLFLD